MWTKLQRFAQSNNDEDDMLFKKIFKTCLKADLLLREEVNHKSLKQSLKCNHMHYFIAKKRSLQQETVSF